MTSTVSADVISQLSRQTLSTLFPALLCAADRSVPPLSDIVDMRTSDQVVGPTDDFEPTFR
jgi:hypothetical protein